MFKVIYKGKDDLKVKKEATIAFDFVSKIFVEKISEITIYVYQNRAEFDKQFGEKTKNWLVGNAVGSKRINILSPLAFKNESCHEVKEFLPILKHELTHLFIYNLADGKTVPKWLNEGLASYVAKQHKNNSEDIYIEDNFSEKLATSKGWAENVHYGAYPLAALFVNFLIKNYSFNKIKELITSLNKVYYYSSFKKIFFKVYGYDLSEVENLFIKSICK